MDYTYYEYTTEPLIREEIMENYVDTWDDEWKTIVQEVVAEYLDKPLSEMSEDDIWTLDGIIFERIDEILGLDEDSHDESVIESLDN